MIQITPNVALADSEIELTAVRSQGPGGQNVNKVATAIALRFDINASSLPERYKTGLMALPDKRIKLVNLFKEGKLDSKVNNGFYASDQFHPSDEGYKIWAALLSS